jgi:hypothetical protein
MPIPPGHLKSLLKDVDLIHTTIAGNRLNANSNQGLGVVLVDGPLGTEVSMEFGIVANHLDVQGEVAVHVQSSSTITFDHVLFAGNEDDTNQGDANSGTFVGMRTTLTASDAGFSSPGPPDSDYHLVVTSPAVDAVNGSTETEDSGLQARDALPDIGADEFGVLSLFEDGFESGNTNRWSSSTGG